VPSGLQAGAVPIEGHRAYFQSYTVHRGGDELPARDGLAAWRPGDPPRSATIRISPTFPPISIAVGTVVLGSRGTAERATIVGG
jgi:hypothetical protein